MFTHHESSKGTNQIEEKTRKRQQPKEQIADLKDQLFENWLKLMITLELSTQYY